MPLWMENSARSVKFTRQSVNNDAELIAGSKRLQSGSVIASCVGNFGVAAINDIDVIINQQLQAYIPKKLKAEFLRELISISKVYFELVGTAATLVYVNQQGFEELPVTFPPEAEQQEVIGFVEKTKSEYKELVQLSQQRPKPPRRINIYEKLSFQSDSFRYDVSKSINPLIPSPVGQVTRKQVEILKERRTALISAAVTGKIDVRDWQAPEQKQKVAV